MGLRTYFDELLARTLAAGGDSYSISTAHLRFGRAYDVLTHTGIVACIKQLLGGNVIGWGSHFYCKLPGDGKRVSWHQDSSYWPLTPSQTVSVWLAIDDANVDNACVRYSCYASLGPSHSYTPSENNEENVLGLTAVAARLSVSRSMSSSKQARSRFIAISGCTVHRRINRTDDGPASVRVRAGVDPDELKAYVAEGLFISELKKKFARIEKATGNEEYSIGSARW